MREAPKQSVEAFTKELFNRLNEDYLPREQAKILSDVRQMMIHQKEQEIEKHMISADEAKKSLHSFIEIMEGPKQESYTIGALRGPFSGDELRKYQ